MALTRVRSAFGPLITFLAFGALAGVVVWRARGAGRPAQRRALNRLLVMASTSPARWARLQPVWAIAGGAGASRRIFEGCWTRRPRSAARQGKKRCRPFRDDCVEHVAFGLCRVDEPPPIRTGQVTKDRFAGRTEIKSGAGSNARALKSVRCSQG